MTKVIRFTKMHGAGNDYIYVYSPDNPIANPGKAALKWSKPHTGIGSDGLIIIGRSDKADFSMRMFNNDGSEGKMCGNGIRCVGKYVYDHSLTNKKTVTVETLAGIKTIVLHTDETGMVDSATVDMGEPSTDAGKWMVSGGEGQMSVKVPQGTFVDMGSPHYVIFTEDINTVKLEEDGPAIERSGLFPDGCNIEFAQVLPDHRIRTRVWERGSGITEACGTGACATGVAACLQGRSGRTSQIVMDGGALGIEWCEDDRMAEGHVFQKNHVYMTGPAEFVFDGEIECP